MKRTRNLRGIRSRKSQVWISDYTLSLLLFILAVLISIKILINSFAVNSDFNELKDDAAKMSEMLLSEGYPVDWTNDTVIRPGLLTGERLDQTKVYNAMNMSYARLKPKLQTKHDFLVIFEDPDSDMIEFNDKCIIGSPSVTINSTGSAPNIDCHNPLFSSIDYNNLVKLTRLVIYNGEIIKMVVYAWNE